MFKKYDKIKFGPAGLGSPAEDGLDKCSDMNLRAAEVEFVYGVRMKTPTAKSIGKKAKELGISLSVHAPYYVNLASKEDDKIKASKERIINASKRADDMGAKYVVFHPGFYQGRDKDKVFSMIEENISDIMNKIKSLDLNIQLAPETTGKASQFGDIDELLRIKKSTGCHFCIDFAHIYARNIGKIDYDEVFSKIKSIGHIHSHFSGINYTSKGERNHELMTKDFFNPLRKALIKYSPDITIINESPDPFGDALKLKNWLNQK